MSLDRSVLWRAAAIQAVAVAVLAAALGLTLPHSFFAAWGWLAGPAAWIACAALCARVLRLPSLPTLGGAALAGLPSALATLAGAHWLGAALAVGLFAVWCAGLAGRGAAARSADA